MEKFITHFFAWFLLGLALSTNTTAHPNGTSKVDFTILENSIRARVDVNADDMTYLTFPRGLDWDSMSRVGRVQACISMAQYIETRLILEADEERLAPMQVLEWFSGRPEIDTAITKYELPTGTHVYEVSWPRKPEAQVLNFSSNLFAEFAQKALCVANALWKERPLMDSTILMLDDYLTLPLNPDSLDTLVQRHAASKIPQVQKSQKAFLNKYLWLLILISLAALAAIPVFLMKRKNKPA